jgi:lipopolysaccharide biosynthesis glycosyltransferase
MNPDINIQSEEIQVLFCSNRRYCEHMAVAIVSLLTHNSKRRFRLHVVLTDSPGEEKHRIEQVVRRFPNAAIDFKSYDCGRIDDFRVDDHITLDSYVRLFLPELVSPDVRKLIYLDCDLLVCSDLEELWNTNLREHIVAAVPDAFSEDHGTLGFAENETYFNAGVLLINVERWRSARLTDNLVDYIRNNMSVLRHHDQDAINAVLRGSIMPLPLKWNFTPRHADADPTVLGMSRREFMPIRHKPGIVHFASGFKPWLNGAEPHYKNWYYRYHVLTPWGEVAPPGSHRSFNTLRALPSRAKAALKWHFPLFSSMVRRWTGVGDPIFQRKLAQRRSCG